ncbi:hypothetical protein BYT27DRAFT_6741275 [Phlegmacium glaucopus]|nr:hypothetical protein BYT27DRAFT_6741275 [Phlegmacium glaucopus]
MMNILHAFSSTFTTMVRFVDGYVSGGGWGKFFFSLLIISIIIGLVFFFTIYFHYFFSLMLTLNSQSQALSSSPNANPNTNGSNAEIDLGPLIDEKRGIWTRERVLLVAVVFDEGDDSNFNAGAKDKVKGRQYQP